LSNDWVVIEGVGGVLVAINSKTVHARYDGEIQVARDIGGAQQHRHGEPHAAHFGGVHAAELPVHGVVLIATRTRENRETIERFGHVRVIGEIPRLPNLHRTALMQVFMSHFDRGAFSQ